MLALISVKRWQLDRVCYGVGCAGIAATLLVVAAGRDEPRSVPALPFSERWTDVPVRIIPLTRQVKTIAVLPETASVFLPILDLEGVPDIPVPKQVKRTQPLAHDICRGKGRIYVRGGKSWRCRR